MKDETNNKDTGQFAQPFDRMRDVDHAAAIEVGKRAEWAKGTVGPRLTAYRLLLGAIEREPWAWDFHQALRRIESEGGGLRLD